VQHLWLIAARDGGLDLSLPDLDALAVRLAALAEG